jgi:hypothetical protein
MRMSKKTRAALMHMAEFGWTQDRKDFGLASVEKELESKGYMARATAPGHVKLTKKGADWVRNGFKHTSRASGVVIIAFLIWMLLR